MAVSMAEGVLRSGATAYGTTANLVADGQGTLLYFSNMSAKEFREYEDKNKGNAPPRPANELALRTLRDLKASSHWDAEGGMF
jgi:hypothetical protein